MHIEVACSETVGSVCVRVCVCQDASLVTKMSLTRGRKHCITYPVILIPMHQGKGDQRGKKKARDKEQQLSDGSLSCVKKPTYVKHQGGKTLSGCNYGNGGQTQNNHN